MIDYTKRRVCRDFDVTLDETCVSQGFSNMTMVRYRGWDDGVCLLDPNDRIYLSSFEIINGWPDSLSETIFVSFLSGSVIKGDARARLRRGLCVRGEGMSIVSGVYCD